jgi:thiamine-phosphate pyrophosphorylase
MAAGIEGLYAVTPDIDDTGELVLKVEAALAGGASVLQYRNKVARPALRLAQARALQPLAREHGVPFVINDDLELAIEVDADGVHLGADDAPLAAARRQWRPDRVIGVSCYNRIELALAAERAGANYVAFGSFFASPVKPGAVAATPALLEEARRQIALPLVAIGGITPGNASRLIAAGADAVAVISALFGAPDVRAAAARFARLFAGLRST